MTTGKMIIQIVIFLFVVSLSIHARAGDVLGTVTLNTGGTGAVRCIDVWLSLDDNYNPSNPATYEIRRSVGSGVLRNIKAASSGDGNLLADIFAGLCVDVAQLWYRGAYNVITPADAPQIGSSDKAALLSELWGRYFNEEWFDHIKPPPLAKVEICQKPASGGSPIIVVPSGLDEEAAAFAVAVWEIVNERSGVLDVTGGSFMLARGGMNQPGLGAGHINDMLQSLDGTGPTAELRVLSNPMYQDLLVRVR